jgi:hypothetical protein
VRHRPSISLAPINLREGKESKMTRFFPGRSSAVHAPSPSPTDMSHAHEADLPEEISEARLKRLLSDAEAALRHALAFRHNEALRRIAQRRSHFDPNQPRVPAGNPDGGQWTSSGRDAGTQFVAADKPRPGPGVVLTIAAQLAQRLIEAYRSENGLWDLFGRRRGTVTVTTINGSEVFGSNSTSPTFTRNDRAAAERMRTILSEKHPEAMKKGNVAEKPNDALFHAETTVMLRAARENGGTLAGQSLEVIADRPMCDSCKKMLPYVGLELGNPTITFVDPAGLRLIMRDGTWVK